MPPSFLGLGTIGSGIIVAPGGEVSPLRGSPDDSGRTIETSFTIQIDLQLDCKLLRGQSFEDQRDDQGEVK